MKNQKDIAMYFLLLLWAGLLCLSGNLKAGQLQLNTASNSLSTSAEQLKTEEQAFPVAWQEPSVPQRAANPDPGLPGLVSMYSPQVQQLTQLRLMPTKAILGFSTLTEQFQILPNAP
ncbi:MAG: hypothetical protein LPK03_00195 [Pontibacter sp.]|nr:hypothetical protein [Pontibacter sp.]